MPGDSFDCVLSRTQYLLDNGLLLEAVKELVRTHEHQFSMRVCTYLKIKAAVFTLVTHLYCICNYTCIFITT